MPANPSPKRNCSAAFRMTDQRGGYLRQGKGHAPDVVYNVPGMADEAVRSPKGSAAFRGTPSSARDSYVKAQHRGHSGASGSYNMPGLADDLRRTPTGRFAPPSPKNSARDSYIKGSRKGCGPDASYEVPGLAERQAQSPKGRYGFTGHAQPRDSYIKAERRGNTEPTGTYSSFSSPARNSPSAAFRGAPGSGRGAYLRTANQINDVSYNVPGMAERVASSRKTSSAFAGAVSSRDSYIRAEGRGSTEPASLNSPQGLSSRASSRAFSPSLNTSGRDGYLLSARSAVSTDASYNVPGMADEILRSPKGRINRAETPRDSYIKGSRKGCGPDTSYNVPGTTDELLRSPKGRYGFTGTPTGRDSYIKGQRKGQSDVSYDFHGMGGVMTSPLSSRRQSAAVRR